ncbi:leucine-rich repeat protein [Treponema sp. OMZ 803]|uniref:leucine-rich repeat protein n=1 Tax=Treponema sp. OMZ 803 TaxID=120682 RepID=UPI0020A5CA16|nr:leucine-rich repeat protein [Treponema sp. OMZ 803]UTC54022.1 leucine-rich repeat protein [Treponema sp. OMZ 803]
MRKLCTILTGIFLTLLFTNCQPFKDNIEDYLSYWSAEVIATDYRINPSYSTNAAGALCVPSIAANGSDTDVTVTVKLHNPKNFNLKTPSSSTDAGKVIRFPGLSPQPEYGNANDYILTQTALDTLTLTYKSSFLKKYEWGTGDISPEITFLTADNDRVFRQKFRLNLKADTAPALEYKGIGKTLVDGERYYVLIFQAKGMDAMIGTEYVHRDIKKLHITKEGGASAVYTIQNINFSSQTFSWSLGDPFLNTADDLVIGDYVGSKPPFPAATDKWLIYYKTDIEISPSSAAKTYTAQPSDAAGLRSNEVECSTVKRKVGFIDLVVTNPSSYIHQSGETGEQTHPYSIRCDENGAILQATCNTPPGVTISYTVYDITSSTAVQTSKGSGASPRTGIRLIAPGTVGHTKQYKVVLKATAPGFTEDTRDVYYTLIRAGDVTIDASTLNANEKWKKLREAVENATAGDIITINGEIKATSVGSGPDANWGKITINKDLTIRGKSGKYTDILNADTATTGKIHRIFAVQSGATLTLSGLTLKGGTAVAGANGGAIFVASGSKVKLSHCTIEGCKANSSGGGGAIGSQGTVTTEHTTISSCSAKNGGGIYARNSIVSLSDSTIVNCTAIGSDKQGGAVYIENSTFTIKGGTSITPSSGSDENVKGKNDVYLKNSQTITIDGNLTGTSPIARITPENYTDGAIVVQGTSSFTLPSGYAQKFVITPSTNTDESWALDDSTNNQLKLKDYGVFTIAATLSLAGDKITLSWKNNESSKTETITNQPYRLMLSPYITDIKLEAECSSSTFLKKWTLIGGGTPPPGYTVEYPNSTSVKGKTITAVFAGRSSLPAGLNLSSDGKTIEKYTGTESIINFNDRGLGCVEEIAANAFRNESGGSFIDNTTIQEVVLPNGLKKLGSYAFFDCTALKKVTIPSGFTGDINEVFPGCTALEKYVIAAGNPRYCLSTQKHLCSKKETAPGSYAPNDLTLVSVVFKPSTHPILNITDSRIKEIKNMAAEFHTFTKIQISGLTALSKIYQYAFFKSGGGGYEVTINTSTPPALPEDPSSVFVGATKIKVPSGSVNAYKAAWTNYAGIIE